MILEDLLIDFLIFIVLLFLLFVYEGGQKQTKIFEQRSNKHFVMLSSICYLTQIRHIQHIRVAEEIRRMKQTSQLINNSQTICFEKN